MLPSLARGETLAEPPSDGEAEAAPADDEAPATGDDDDALPADVVNPELAAAAPRPDWVREGYGTGTGVTGVDADPRVLNRKIRRAGTVTLAGGGVAILGGAIAITGAILIYGVRPSTGLAKLANKNGGTLPTDSDKRQQLISIARAGPIVAYTGLGVLVAGVITAGIARWRLKKLREQRRTSVVSFAPTTLGHGAEVHWEVRF